MKTCGWPINGRVTQYLFNYEALSTTGKSFRTEELNFFLKGGKKIPLVLTEAEMNSSQKASAAQEEIELDKKEEKKKN